MLDCFDERHLTDPEWEALELRAILPTEISFKGFFKCSGPSPRFPEDQRQFHRFYLRLRAILRRGTSELGVYTTDVSRAGIGFISPVQLLPLERVALCLPNRREMSLEATRCHRLEKRCFLCGTRFVRDS
jgi:hypothetical protein